MPSQRRPKNKFCKNTHLNEDEFLAILWAYSSNLGASEARSLIEEHFGQKISRPTINRYLLLLGDYQFDVLTKQNPDMLKEKWPLGIYALYKSLYSDSDDEETEESHIDEEIAFFQSAKFRPLFYDVLRDHSRRGKGIPLERFCSYLGRYNYRLQIWDNQPLEQRSFNDISNKMLENLGYHFMNRPLDPHNVLSYYIKDLGSMLSVFEVHSFGETKSWNVAKE